MIHNLDIWIREIEQDFPEFSKEIERIANQAESNLYLISDYYFCKTQIRRLMELGKIDLVTQYEKALVELTEEILMHVEQLSNKTILK